MFPVSVCLTVLQVRDPFSLQYATRYATTVLFLFGCYPFLSRRCSAAPHTTVPANQYHPFLCDDSLYQTLSV